MLILFKYEINNAQNLCIYEKVLMYIILECWALLRLKRGKCFNCDRGNWTLILFLIVFIFRFSGICRFCYKVNDQVKIFIYFPVLPCPVCTGDEVALIADLKMIGSFALAYWNNGIPSNSYITKTWSTQYFFLIWWINMIWHLYFKKRHFNKVVLRKKSRSLTIFWAML